jgi:hypothetical protein
MNGVNTTYASGFTYNPASQVTGLSYGSGVVQRSLTRLIDSS